MGPRHVDVRAWVSVDLVMKVHDATGLYGLVDAQIDQPNDAYDQQSGQ